MLARFYRTVRHRLRRQVAKVSLKHPQVYPITTRIYGLASGLKRQAMQRKGFLENGITARMGNTF